MNTLHLYSLDEKLEILKDFIYKDGDNNLIDLIDDIERNIADERNVFEKISDRIFNIEENEELKGKNNDEIYEFFANEIYAATNLKLIDGQDNNRLFIFLDYEIGYK